jgi:hypothetical protein
MALRLPGSRVLSTGIGLAMLFACGDDRPASTDALSATMLPPALETSNDPTAPLPSTVVEGPCTPGDWVPCHMWYRDGNGKLQCPMSVALCRPDGLATYPCGAWTRTPDGPRLLDGGADAELLNE